MLGRQPSLHMGVFGAFSVFAMPKPYPAVAFIENLAGKLYVEAPKSVRFEQAYDTLRASALGLRESSALIASIAEELP